MKSLVRHFDKTSSLLGLRHVHRGRLKLIVKHDIASKNMRRFWHQTSEKIIVYSMASFDSPVSTSPVRRVDIIPYRPFASPPYRHVTSCLCLSPTRFPSLRCAEIHRMSNLSTVESLKMNVILSNEISVIPFNEILQNSTSVEIGVLTLNIWHEW